jgi:hypothetical protein
LRRAVVHVDVADLKNPAHRPKYTTKSSEGFAMAE